METSTPLCSVIVSEQPKKIVVSVWTYFKSWHLGEQVNLLCITGGLSMETTKMSTSAASPYCENT
jgi:hypothetical protein